MDKMKNNKEAYTLIEVAIVLAVISLLVSSVVAGAILIQHAKMVVLMDEMRTYSQAVKIFKDTTKKWPGDKNKSRKIGYSSGQNYDNNSFGAPYTSSNSNYGVPTDSIGPLVDLFQKKYIDFEPKKYSNSSSTSDLDWNNGGSPISKAFPEFIIRFKYQAKNSITDTDSALYKTHGNYLTFNSKNEEEKNKYHIPAKVIKNIDKKLDDGIYNKGTLRGSCQKDDGTYSDYDIVQTNDYKCYEINYLLDYDYLLK